MPERRSAASVSIASSGRLRGSSRPRWSSRSPVPGQASGQPAVGPGRAMPSRTKCTRSAGTPAATSSRRECSDTVTTASARRAIAASSRAQRG